MSARLQIAVDVTPIRADGANGGAKPFVLALLSDLAARRRHTYTLLTTAHNHRDFAAFEAKGMRRLRVDGKVPPIGLASLGFDVLFCPMTSPQFAEPGVATVCTLYDLQHLVYPWFFNGAELVHRAQFYQALCERADAIVAISEFSRDALVGHFDVPVDRTSVVPIAIHQRLAVPTAVQARTVLSALGVPATRFAFYPANFWPHKNHRFLFLAFERFLRDVPGSDLHLVLTGDMLDRETEIRAAITRMKLAGRVHVLGFVTDVQLAAIWREATLLVFPSLYEGFGIPVLEALQFGKPVLSSREGSLPEVGGDDVTYFDARDPQTLIDALRQVLRDLPAATRRAEAARRRLAQADSRKSADDYAQIFERVAAARPIAVRKLRRSWSQRAGAVVSGMNRDRRKRGAEWIGAGCAAWRRGHWSGLARMAAGVAWAPEIVAGPWFRPVTDPLVAALRRRHWILRDDTKRWLATTELQPDDWAGPTWTFEATIGPNDRALVLCAHPVPGTPFASQVLHAFIGDRPLGARPMPAADLFSVSWPLGGIDAGKHAIRITAQTFVVPDDVLENGDCRPLAYRVVWAGPDSGKSADDYAQILERVKAARPIAVRKLRPSGSQRAGAAVSRMNRDRRKRGAEWISAGCAAWRRGHWSGLARMAAGVAWAPEIVAEPWFRPVTDPLVAALRRRHWILRDDTKRWLATAELQPDDWAGPTWIFEATIGPNDRALVLRAHPVPGTPFASQVLHAFIGERPLGARPMPAADLFSVSWPLGGIGAGKHAIRITAQTFVVPDDVLENGDSRPLAYHVVWAGPSEIDLPG